MRSCRGVDQLRRYSNPARDFAHASLKHVSDAEFSAHPLAHTHTSYSMDAGAFGARLGPKDAYRFAKGEEVIASSGQRAKLSRPLDFMVVADHSDGMGFFPQLIGGDPGLLATPQGRKSRQINPGTHNLLFKIPALGEDLRLAIYIKLPEGTQDVASKDERSPDGRPGNSALDAPVHPLIRILPW